jgi:hypothetical protein
VANLPLVSFTLVAFLPPVSTTPVVPVGKFTASVVDTSAKFATGVVDTWIVNISVNFQKNKMILKLFSGFMEKPEAENLVTLFLYVKREKARAT